MICPPRGFKSQDMSFGSTSVIQPSLVKNVFQGFCLLRLELMVGNNLLRLFKLNTGLTPLSCSGTGNRLKRKPFATLLGIFLQVLPLGTLSVFSPA